MSLPINQIVCGDCIEVMKGFREESIDCVVTDPPYGIGFMGKEWDKALPPHEAFAEMFRVLKPGALAFVMSSPRQDVLWRMMRMLEECGFQLRQSFVSWIYKSGFPKAYDLSLGIDKKFIREEFVREHGRKPTKEELKKLLSEKRKFVAFKSAGLGKNRLLNDDNWDGVGQDPNKIRVSEPASDLAKKWNGYKGITGLKPALECVLMVNKPLGERTIVDNVLKHGVGAINVDACRIPFEQTDDIHAKNPHTTHKEEATYECYSKRRTDVYKIPEGRFPANLLVSDRALDTGKITKSSPIGFKNVGWRHSSNTKEEMTEMRYRQLYGDIGGASRFFDLDAWAEHRGFLQVPKASKSERNKGLETLETKPSPFKVGYKVNVGRKAPKGSYPRKNVHPTVKPIKLGAYLTTLGCPPDGVMLDPFCGTGSFLIGAHTVGRRWIGIDNKKEYVEISKHRIGAYSQQLTKFY